MPFRGCCWWRRRWNLPLSRSEIQRVTNACTCACLWRRDAGGTRRSAPTTTSSGLPVTATATVGLSDGTVPAARAVPPFAQLAWSFLNTCVLLALATGHPAAVGSYVIGTESCRCLTTRPSGHGIRWRRRWGGNEQGRMPCRAGRGKSAVRAAWAWRARCWRRRILMTEAGGSCVMIFASQPVGVKWLEERHRAERAGVWTRRWSDCAVRWASV